MVLVCVQQESTCKLTYLELVRNAYPLWGADVAVVFQGECETEPALHCINQLVSHTTNKTKKREGKKKKSTYLLPQVYVIGSVQHLCRRTLFGLCVCGLAANRHLQRNQKIEVLLADTGGPVPRSDGLRVGGGEEGEEIVQHGGGGGGGGY